jgi:hypothetical protein
MASKPKSYACLKRKRCQPHWIDRFLVRAHQATKIAVPWIIIFLVVVGTVSPEHAEHLASIL